MIVSSVDLRLAAVLIPKPAFCISFSPLSTFRLGKKSAFGLETKSGISNRAGVIRSSVAKDDEEG